LASEAVKKRRNKVMPKSTSDLVALLRFIGELEEKALPQRKTEPGEVDLSVRKAIAKLVGDDEKGREMAQTVVKDLRRKLRVIHGKVNNDEDSEAVS
jgi:hypothetical protein